MYLGVAMLSLTPSILEKCRELPNFPRDIDHGVLIKKIVVGSSAHKYVILSCIRNIKEEYILLTFNLKLNYFVANFFNKSVLSVPHLI